MAIEKRRGCGFRKVGGTYLVSSGEGMPCDRLPIKLDVCPVCSHGFKQSRGWTWVDLFGLVGGPHEISRMAGLYANDEREELTECECFPNCPLCKDPKKVGKAGLLWIGEKFYKTPGEFMAEGREMGFSRRVSAIPRNFKVGETWVMLAHSKTFAESVPDPEALAKLRPDIESGNLTEEQAAKLCPSKTVYAPGIFTLWRPQRIEKLFIESQRDSEEVKKAIDQGITPVFVPDNDPDHKGTVYDKDEEEEESTAAAA